MDIRTEEINGERYYLVNGNRYVSVTTVFNILEKHGLSQWRARVGQAEADRITNEAGEFGTNLHYVCQLAAEGTEPEEVRTLIGSGKYAEQMAEDLLIGFNRFWEWFECMVDEVVGVEEAVYSDSWGVAGRLDFILRLKGDTKLSICDIKTGKLKPIAKLQTAAYRGLVTECTSLELVDVERRVLIPVPRGKNAPVKIKEFPKCEADHDLNAYLSLVNVWKWFKGK